MIQAPGVVGAWGGAEDVQAGRVVVVMLGLFAQADPISGGAGWVGAGLLGSVLAWFLLVRIPAQDRLNAEKDKLIAQIMTDKDKLLKTILDSKDGQLEKKDVLVGHAVDQLAQSTEIVARLLQRMTERRKGAAGEQQRTDAE